MFGPSECFMFSKVHYLVFGLEPGKVAIPYIPKAKVRWLSGWLSAWLAGWLAGWPVGWLAGWLAGWLPGWLCRLLGWLAGWLARSLAGCGVMGAALTVHNS